jgi:hypothetical protein
MTLFTIKPSHFPCYSEDAVFIFMEPVERKIVAGHQVDDEASAHAYGEAHDIDGSVHFLAFHDSPGEQQVVTEHKFVLR